MSHSRFVGQIRDSLFPQGIRKVHVLPVLLWLAALVLLWAVLPRPLFRDPYSTVLLDRDGGLLGARLAQDQQWRFPSETQVPEKFGRAIVMFEDRWFRFHPGFNPASLFRAARLNISRGRIVSGGSTITMQVIRLARKNRPRNMGEKLVEIFLAWRLELTHTKDEILRMYASHAPFGGNVVGLEAAAWRYFGVDAGNLSWAQAATLAVLPNAPGLIYPGRNPDRLVAKRNRLLMLLRDRGVIDTVTCRLAMEEQMAGRPYPLPQHAPHLLVRAMKDGFRGQKLVTTIDPLLQQRTGWILNGHNVRWSANGIRNAAVIVAEVAGGEVVAYHGNLPGDDRAQHGREVDVAMAPRSTGSVLKPLLYAAMLSDGMLLPNTLVPDIPTQIGGFVPENHNLTYDGAVPAGEALARSLNIPAVKMLQQYGYEPFYQLLRRMGFSTLDKPAGHYGLALILGGAEATLWDLAGVYASMARSLNGAGNEKSRARQSFFPLHYLFGKRDREGRIPAVRSPLGDAALWFTAEAMVEVTRPGEELLWRQFGSAGRVAWKTGTSFGNRDAWAIGITPGYVVAVWVGNASGEGRPGLTGISEAAPVLFDIFRALPSRGWFRQPEEGITRIAVCRYSGHRAGPLCEPVDSVAVPDAGLKTTQCHYHQVVHLDTTGQWQVAAGCYPASLISNENWFVLPPVQEWYFRNKNPWYRALPPFMPGCARGERKNMELIYPRHNAILYLPTELDGRPGTVILKAVHRNPAATIFWHLDDRLAGTTKGNHQVPAMPDKGLHRLTLQDGSGESLSVIFEVINDKKSGK